MKDSKFVSPNYCFQDKIVTSDRCYWCGEHGRMTDSHLFPQVLGTRFYTRTTCTLCNSFLGHAVESTLLENVFVTAALAKLKLRDKARAYGKAIDIETGFEMRFRPDGVAEPITKARGKSGYVGTRESIDELVIKKFARQYPNWPTKPLEDFYKDSTARSFKYAGQRFTKKIIPGKITTLAVKKSGQVRSAVIFKIAYEWLCLSDIISIPAICKLVQGMFSVQKSQSTTGVPIHEIQFADEIERRLIRFGEVPADEVPDLEELPFMSECFVVNRKTKDGIVFVHVNLFQYLDYFLVLDKIESDSIPKECFNNSLFVSTKENGADFVELDEAKFPERIASDSGLVDAWYEMIQRPTSN